MQVRMRGGGYHWDRLRCCNGSIDNVDAPSALLADSARTPSYTLARTPCAKARLFHCRRYERIIISKKQRTHR